MPLPAKFMKKFKQTVPHPNNDNILFENPFKKENF